MSNQSCNPVADATSVLLAPPGYREAFLAIFILCLILITFGVVTFLAERKRSGRLAKRSVTLLFVSSLSSLLSCVVVFYREYHGRDTFPCLAVLVLHHLVIPFVAAPLVAKVYVHAYRLRRSQIRAGLSFAAVKKEQERIDRGETKPGQGIVQDMSSFVRLQGKSGRGKQAEQKGAYDKSHHKPDNFEMVSPVPEEPFDAVQTDDEYLEEAAARANALLTPIKASSQHQRQGSSASDAKTTTTSRQSLVEMTPTNYQNQSAPSSPMLNSKGSRRSKTKTEEIVKKASRNSSATAAQFHRDSKKTSRVSSSFGVGWWSPRAQDLEAEVRLDELIKHESTIWGLFMVVLFASPFLLVILIRALTDSDYQPGCTGCDFSAIDVYVQCGLSVFMLGIFFASTIIMWNAPDPLGIIWESKLCMAVFLLFCLPTAALYLNDPGGLEKQYRFTWLAFETIAVFLILMIQTFGQVGLTRLANRRVPRNISLFRLLENVELRDMFDDHLASEFSIENLRFWDRAIHWKAAYEEMPQDEVQRRARDLYQVFIQRDAAMALNLSAINLQKLQVAFASSDPVPRQVFDDALKECFRLMNDGLARFLVSEKYRSFLKHAPDFEGDMLRNQELGIDLNVTVDQYLKQLEGLHRPSFTAGSLGSAIETMYPRKGSRQSLVSQFNKRPMSDHGTVSTTLTTSKEESVDEEHIEDEKARPISMRVRQSISHESPVPSSPTNDRRRDSSASQLIAGHPLTSSPPSSNGAKVAQGSPVRTHNDGSGSPTKQRGPSYHVKKDSSE